MTVQEIEQTAYDRQCLHWLDGEARRFDDAPGARSTGPDGVTVVLAADGVTVLGTYHFGGRYVPFETPRDVTVGAAVEGLQHVYEPSGRVDFETR